MFHKMFCKINAKDIMLPNKPIFNYLLSQAIKSQTTESFLWDIFDSLMPIMKNFFCKNNELYPYQLGTGLEYLYLFNLYVCIKYCHS